LANFQLINTRSPERLSLGQEGGLACFTVTARKAVGGKPPNRWSIAHEYASTMLCDYQPFRLELRDSLSHGHPSHPVVLHELRLGRHTTTRLKVPTLDRSAQLVRNLSVRRGVRHPIDRAEFMHSGSSSSLVVL